jgi:Lsr2
MMAEKVVRYLTDDMEDGEVRAAETIEYTWEGKPLEIDLGTQNATKFRAQMATWVAHSRDARVLRRRTQTNGRVGSPERNLNRAKQLQDGAIRAWARSQGIPVKTRGAIPNDVRKAFEEAHIGPAPAPTKALFSGTE